MEQVIQQEGAVEQKTQEVQETKQEVQEAPKEDLVSRVSKVKIEPKKEEPSNPFGLTKEDYDKVQNDPVLSKFYKSMQSDYQRKTTEVAEQRRKIEAQLKESSNWTTEKVQQLLNDPKFVQEAQKVVGNPPNSGLTDQEYSALTDKEKAQLTNMQQQLQQMQLQNWQMQQKQQDDQLKGRYANYAPDIVDTTIYRLVKGEVQANREYVWKAIDYDDAVQRAYELGKQDRSSINQEKQQALSPEGFSATPQQEVPKQDAGESSSAYFKRLATRRLAERNQLNR